MRDVFDTGRDIAFRILESVFVIVNLSLNFLQLLILYSLLRGLSDHEGSNAVIKYVLVSDHNLIFIRRCFDGTQISPRLDFLDKL